MSNWQWPQYVEAALLAFAVVIAVSKHGQPRAPYNGPGVAVSAAIVAWLLYMGGFWS